jgi:hypothetical protein
MMALVLGGNPTSAQLQSEETGDRGGDQIGIGQRGQLDEPTVTLKNREQAARDLQRQRRLSNPAGSRSG